MHLMAVASNDAPTVALRRVLGFRTVLSTSAGLSYAAISFLGCVLVANTVAGDSAWLAILIAGLLALLAAGCFAELNALYPSAAAIRLYIKAAFNERLALIIAFMYTVTIVAVIAADSYVVGSAITHVFPQTPTLLWILLILGLTMAANLGGIRLAGALQDVTTYALLVSASVISVLALATHGFALHTPFAALHDAGGLFNGVTAGVFVFSAFEWVTPLAEEISDHRLIPRGMFIAIGVLFVAYSLFTLATTHLLSVRDVHGAWHLPQSVVRSAFPQMLMAEAGLGTVGKWWMLVATLFTGVMTFNGGFATASRFLYAAAREGTMPAVFARLNGATVPWVTIVALSGASALIAVLIFATGAFQVLILVGAALEAMIYAVAGLCVIQLRRRQPTAARSFMLPGGFVIPGVTVAIFTVLFLGAVVPPANQLPATTSPFVVLGIFVALLALTTVYVLTVVPRMQAKLAAQRATTRRRPPRPAAVV